MTSDAWTLTPAQQAAVDHFEGPLLVLAGPGSGKTRVITRRIARLLERRVPAESILALTFTNKAAREMASRVQRLVPGHPVHVSTFHRFCARLLRVRPEAAGLRSSFTILDQGDQTTLVRRIMKDCGFDVSHFEPRSVLNRISRARNELVTADAFRRRFQERTGDPLDAVVCEVFPKYEQQLLSQNAVDFDALLLHVVDILTHCPEQRELLGSRYRFLLVDEYQDTNLAQYRILTGLSQVHGNVCATGDPDQSIYGWRGARPDNIVQFERDFSDVTVVMLDENFRSTASIVSCADQLIACNARRYPRRLTTPNPPGVPVKLRGFATGDSEADGIAAEIAASVRSGQRTYSDYAVFYRVNALSRSLETALSRYGVPFQVAAGLSFYERMEIRDLLGYLRVIENDADESALLRIINRPARGIGQKTLMHLSRFADHHGITLFEAACRAGEVPSLTSRSRRSLLAFTDIIRRLQEQAAQESVAGVIERLLAEIDYLALWRDDDNEIDQDRAANVYELISAARQYEAQAAETDDVPSLQGFLELAGLTSEADSIRDAAGAVTLMTMHAAKGLEFPVVYVLGLENGLIPHERAVRDGDPAAFEEERRLLFVAVTRAQEELHLTRTRERTFRGQRRTTIASPFTDEMPLEYDDVDAVWPQSDCSEPTENPSVQQARQQRKPSDRKPAFPALMTGSQLLKRHQESHHRDGGSETFPAGTPVRHPLYGRGIVVRTTGTGHRATVTVRFETADEDQTFIADRCPLQPAGPPRKPSSE